MIGHRPTWPLGKRAARVRAGTGDVHFEDGYAVFSDDAEQDRPRRPERHLTRLQWQALDMLNLERIGHLERDKGAV